MEKKLRNRILAFLLTLLLPSLAFGQSQVSGNLFYHDIYPLGGIEATLINSSGDEMASTITAADGLYQFNNVPQGTYTVSFENENDGGGVDLADAFLVLLYNQGLFPLNEIQLLAADVNGNGSVNYADYVLILVSYLHNGNPFPVGEWVFEDVEITVGQRDVPITKAASAGDVNGTYVPEKKIKSSAFVLDQENAQVNARPGETVKLEMTLQEVDEIAGMHMHFDVPEGLSITGIESITDQFEFTLVDHGFKITWMNEAAKGIAVQSDEPVLTLSMKVDETIDQEGELALSLRHESHFIDGQGELIRSIGITLPSVKVMPLQLTGDIQHHVYPNPFIHQATFSYALPEPGRVTVNIYNSNGQLVTRVADEYQEAGNQQVVYNGALMTPGIYYYTIQVDGDNEFLTRGSMIKSK